MNSKPPHLPPKPNPRKKPLSALREHKPETPAPATERIQKVLARGGLGSRREIERWIEEGRLSVNGKKVTLGQILKSGDLLFLNDRIVHWERFTRQPTRVLVYNKPVGEVVTRRDPEGRPTVFSRLPKLPVGRWIAVGRLDINTSGLLLLTNNGELANRLMHPKTEIDREYAVRILGEVDQTVLERLKTGVELEDGMAHFDDIQFFAGEGANKWFHVVVREGRNRLVRRLWESQQVTVSRLMRVRYGPAVLPEQVRAHEHYELNQKELAILLEFAGLPAEEHAGISVWQKPLDSAPAKPADKKAKPEATKKIYAPKKAKVEPEFSTKPFFNTDKNDKPTRRKPYHTKPKKR